MKAILGGIFVVVGVIPLELARRAVRSGVVAYGDHVSKHRYTRAARPGSFWAGVVFSMLMGIGCMVLGLLAGLGVIGAEE